MDNKIYERLISYYPLYAHTKKDERETLSEHTERTLKYYNKLVRIHGIKNVFSNICSNQYLDINEKLISNYIEKIMTYHDIGKANPLFQRRKMNNSELAEIKLKKISTKHSVVSFFIFLLDLLDNLDSFKDKNQEKELICIIILSISIWRHHSSLENIDYKDIAKRLNNLQEDIKSILKYYKIDIPEHITYISQENSLWHKIEARLITVIKPENLTYLNFLFKTVNSLLIASDYYATSEYKSDKEIDIKDSILQEKIKVELFNRFFTDENVSNNFNPGIEKRKEEIRKKRITKIKDLNECRNWLNVIAEYNLNKNIDKNIFYLNVPTGGGKTNLSFRLALRIMEQKNIKKIFYVFPFINIIEQAYDSLEKFIPQDSNGVSQCVRLDSKAPIKLTKKDEEELLTEIDFSLSFMNYPILFLSNVKFFDLFFRKDKPSNYNFYQLANSVVILDEIQSYDDKLWTLLSEIIFKASKALNIHFIIMSATLPRLDKLIESEAALSGEKTDIKFCELLDEETRKDIFRHQCFNRLSYDFSKLSKNNQKKGRNKKTIEEIIKKELKDDKNKFLVVLNTIKDSIEIYKNLSEGIKKEFSKKLLLNSTFIDFDRNRIISEVKKSPVNEKILLVSTQSIEAGVDVDFDVAIRSYAPIDSIIQIGGRVNRENKKENCKTYVINDDRWYYVYGGNYKYLVAKNKDYQKELKNIGDNELKIIETFFENITKKISTDNQTLYIENSKDKILSLRYLQFDELGSVRIIEKSESIPVYIKTRRELNRTEDKRYIDYIKNLQNILKINIITSEDNNFTEVSSEKLWKEFIKIVKSTEDTNFFKKKLHLKYLQKLMNLFSVNLRVQNTKVQPQEFGYILADDREYNSKTGLDIERIRLSPWII